MDGLDQPRLIIGEVGRRRLSHGNWRKAVVYPLVELERAFVRISDRLELVAPKGGEERAEGKREVILPSTVIFPRFRAAYSAQGTLAHRTSA